MRKTLIKTVLLPLLIALFLPLLPAPQVKADAIPGLVGLGILGDSGEDEYRANDNRGGDYAATTFNWIELMARYRGLNIGPWGNRSTPRRTGYEYNWALSGATTHSMLMEQPQGLAGQVQAGLVSHVLIDIGANDFAIWNGTYAEIYNGSLDDAELQTKVNGIISDLTASVDIVKAGGPVKILVANFADRGNLPLFRQTFPDPVKRQRITNAILEINQGLQAMADARQDVFIVDLYNYGTTFFTHVDAQGNLNIGGELISLTVDGNEPHHAVLADQDHVGTVMSGLVANFYMGAMISRFGLPLTLFSDQEILANAGIFTPAPYITSLTANPQNITAGGSTTLSWSTQNAVTAEINQGVGTVPVSGSVVITPATTTVYTLTTHNSQGSSTAQSITITVTAQPPVDTTPPAITITSPAANAEITGLTQFTANASDNVGVASVQFYKNGEVLGLPLTTSPYSFQSDVSGWTEGLTEISAVAADAAGNTSLHSVSITVEHGQIINTAPSVNAGANTTIRLPATASLAATVSDDGLPNGNVTVSWGMVSGPGTANFGSPNSAATTASFPTAGVYVISCTASDGALSSSDTVTVTVLPEADTTTPTVTMVSPLNNQIVSGIITLRAEAFDDTGIVGVQFKGDNQPYGAEDTSAPYEIFVDTRLGADGDYTITAQARDAAGNITTSSGIFVRVRNAVAILYPSSYSLVSGTYVSGNTASLTTNNNNYLVTRSSGTGTTRVADTEFAGTGIFTLTPRRLDIQVISKSNKSSTNQKILLYNVVTGLWETVNTATIGTLEVSRTASVISNPSRYISADGTIRVRVNAVKTNSTTFDFSHELVKLTVTP